MGLAISSQVGVGVLPFKYATYFSIPKASVLLALKRSCICHDYMTILKEQIFILCPKYQGWQNMLMQRKELILKYTGNKWKV